MRVRNFLNSIFYLTQLFAHMSALLIVYPIRRRKAKMIFKQQLIQSGLSRSEADELSKAYSEFFSLRELIRLFRRIEA